MSFVKYPFPLKGNSLPTTTTKKLFFYSFFFFNSLFWLYQPGLNHSSFKERMPPAFLCNSLSALLLQPGGRKRCLRHQEPCATGRAGPGRDGGAWWGREKGGPSVTWAGRQLGGFGSCSEDAVSDCVESLERTDSVLGQFRRKTWRARGDASPHPHLPAGSG